ncbi:ferric reductase-like transmembrane domain-containing protein [Leifsonia sp. F6_8S_P_1B]|uniref:Ferric reductase-like transmembrane domain-containing protein n=1 Tax=Leifsonia williamsii TaxID=3035919 RepID=A0ABT8K9Q8_9MICO|nr:ferric reductase-like transmembrane domain-containing protein [Leifsonia williamsii]MDN4614178.1 ferric reductase-like transmembrane domain-containing protein [Leifsonia williamsii]
MTTLAEPARPLPRTTRARPRLDAVGLRVLIAAGYVLAVVMWSLELPDGPVPPPSELARAVGELTGISAGYLTCPQLLLVARVPWFERAVGLDRLVAWHRWLGTAVLTFVGIHVTCKVVGTMFLDGSVPWDAFVTVLTSFPDMVTALIGTLLFLAIGVSAVRRLRRLLSYEAWWLLHLTSYLAVYLTFLHELSAGTHFIANDWNRAAWIALYVATAAALVIWRFVVPTLRAWRHRLRVVAVVPEGDGIVSIWFSGPRAHRLGVEAGNFLLVRFLARGHLLTAHPYSVSRMPDDGLLRITVGASGDHSSRVKELTKGTYAVVEGPYGRFTADRVSRPRVVLIAGGAGIGPLRVIAEELVRRGLEPVLLYRAQSSGRLALLGELRRLPGLTVLPLVGRRSDLGWDPLSPAMLASVLPRPHEWEAFLCGPEGMMRAVEGSLLALGMPRRFIHRETLSMS